MSNERTEFLLTINIRLESAIPYSTCHERIMPNGVFFSRFQRIGLFSPYSYDRFNTI
jgi:hypothetical protein